MAQLCISHPPPTVDVTSFSGWRWPHRHTAHAASAASAGATVELGGLGSQSMKLGDLSQK
jgi:hypothetical protein